MRYQKSCAKRCRTGNNQQRQAGRMTGTPRMIASVVAGILIAGAAAGFAIAWRPAIAAIEPPAPQSFDTALIKRGRDLAAIGNCNDCHTVRGGKDFAGGLRSEEHTSELQS